MHVLIERAIDFFARHRTAVSAITAMAIKGAGALLTVAIFAIAARAMSAEDFGRLAMWFNTVSFLGITAVFGQDTLIARSFGEYAGKKDFGLAWAAYRFGWIMTVASGAFFAITLLMIGPKVAPKVGCYALIGPSLYLFTQTILHYSSHSTRVMVNFLVSEITRDVLWRALLLMVVVWAVMGDGLTPDAFFIAGGVGQLLSFFVATYYVRRCTRTYAYARTGWKEWRLWLSRSLPMWQSAILDGASLYIDVILLGYVASPAEAGSYFAAARIAAIFLMVSGSLNTYTFAHSSALYYSGQLEKLQAILRSLVVVGALILAPMWAVIYFFGASLLTIFGARYGADYPTLLVLATGCFLMSGFGWPSVVLLTTGHEKTYARAMTIATIVRIALTPLLALRFGAIGAAFGWVLVNVPLFAVLAWMCYRKVGVDTSLLSVLDLSSGRRVIALREAVARARSQPGFD
jgi:O-antigen/teichoic acid export membrane protein